MIKLVTPQHLTFLILLASLFYAPITSLRASLFPPSVLNAQIIQKANSDFSLQLFKTACPPDENCVLSPFSISTVLQMLALGARGDTLMAMLTSMGIAQFRGRDIVEIFEEFQNSIMEEYEQRLSENGEYEDSDEYQQQQFEQKLLISNGMFVSSNLTFVDKFLEDAESVFQAEVTDLDFEGDPEGARQSINEWVKEATEGQIEDLMPPGSVTTVSVATLVSAIYFQGIWQFPFDEEETFLNTFKLPDGSTTSVPFMQKTMSLKYNIDRDRLFKIVELPYKDNKTSMFIIIPAGQTLHDLIRQLRGDDFTGLLNIKPTRYMQLYFSMPKFEVSQQMDLIPTLSRLGLQELFGVPDLTGIVETGMPLTISDAVHKAKIVVDEKGTEATAATGVSVLAKSVPQTLSIDEPFLFFIMHKETDTILFAGQVIDPSVAE
eukprot:TRINITY_DN3244_c0_g1_i1.p2 TRINITY_DN3244_c0_g1~~TRINITY_DN3244_c0_g1_i1.p2  ORF type:complete len:434 (-),score=65.73 TRINITY_DN3244_c0_g1_i1:2647-3948(-)